MSTDKKGAEAPKGTTVNPNSNRITSIESSNDTLARVYKIDGSSRMATEQCPVADRVRQSAEVSSLAEAVAALYAGSSNPHECVILGQYVGDEAAKRTPDGRIVVSHDNFKDCPRNLVIFNIGISASASGVEEAAAALLGVLPSYCQDAKYHLHFTKMGKDSVRGYLIFWLEVPTSLSRIKAWAKKTGVINLLPKYWFSCVSQVFLADPIGEDCTVKVPPPVRCSRDGRNLNLLPISDTPSVHGAQTGNTQESNIITIPESYGPRLTKLHKADGSSENYQDAKSFFIDEPEIRGIRGWADYFHKNLAGNIHRAQIHGRLRRDVTLLPGDKEGSVSKTNFNFADQALNLLAIDIDKFEPPWADPLLHPEQAISEFFKKFLPEFMGCSYFWQQSSSAGLPGNEGILKAHIWVWTKQAYTCAQLSEWATSLGPGVIDQAIYRRVQFRFTANPVFEKGRKDPVERRYGLFEGESDVVDLVIKEAILANARETGAGEGGNDQTLKDPSEKDGLIGLFHRTYSAEQVLLELLEGEFIQASQRRFTWVNGGGTPEGVWVHDDDMHVGASHNTWPIDGIANLWDLVREFKFGHLDRSDDAFEQVDLDNLLIQAKPSHLAMVEYASGLEEIKAAIAAEYTGELDRLKELIAGVADAHALEHLVAPVIRQAADLDMTGKIQVEASFRDRWAALVAPAKVTIDRVRKLLAPPRTATADAGAPEWVAEWVWVTSLDKFMQIDTKETITLLSYSAKFDRYMQPFADAEGNVPKAADMSLRFWGTVIVSGAEYAPNAGLFFEREGLMMLNTYRPDLLPAMPEKYSKAELKAIETVETHLEILIPDARDRGLLIDFMAYCVQYPGRKIRWAPLLIGMEGDGKTAFLIMLGLVLGSRNIKTVSNKTLESDFTGWAGGACLIGIEEVKLHNHNRFDVFNALKPVISNDVIDFHAKGKDPVTIPNFCNLFMLTNHSDAMPVSSNDRRIFFLRSPYRNKSELYAAVDARTGMEAGLFHDQLFDHAIKAHPGALRKWLMDRKFSNPDFKPNGRAPENAMRTEAIELSRTEEEVAIIGVIEAGAFGVYPNLVAGSLLTKSVNDQYDMKVSPTRFGAAMASLGWRRVAGYATQWRGKNYCWYYRDEKPSGNPAKLADKLEKARQDNLVGADFTD